MSIGTRIAGIALLAGVMLPAGAQELTRNPYPQNTRTDSADFLWRTDVPAESWIALNERGGTHAVAYHSTVPTTAHEIHVPGLKPDTVYEYRVGAAEGAFLMETPLWFRTFPESMPARLDFVAYGDHRNNPQDHRAVVQAVIAKTGELGWPLFVLDTGDYTGQGEHKTDFYDEQFFQPASGLIEHATFFPAIGNHESERRHPRIPFRYLANFSVPTDNSGTEYYYSFDVGDVHIAVLDVYATDFATGSKQWEWVRRDLDASDATWKFAVMHYPIYIHRSGPTVSYGNTEIREHLVPLFEEFGVTAAFSGDSHFYQRSEVNGVHYICTGGAGAPLYDPGDGEDYIRASAKVNHYTWVTIENGEMTLYAFDRDNNLLDRMTATPRAAIKPPEPELNFVRRMPAADATPAATIIVESRDAEGNVTKAPLYAEEGMMSSTAKSDAPGLAGNGTRFSDTDATLARFTVTPPIAKKGTYLVSVTIPNASSAEAPKTLFEVTSPGAELIRGRVELAPGAAGGKWLAIGLFDLAPGASIAFLESANEPGRFYADAVKIELYE
jgi:hypothetical protein